MRSLRAGGFFALLLLGISAFPNFRDDYGNDHTPQGKPAEAIMARWYRSQDLR